MTKGKRVYDTLEQEKSENLRRIGKLYFDKYLKLLEDNEELKGIIVKMERDNYKKNYVNSRKKRRNLILNCIMNLKTIEVSQGSLYSVCRKKGYPHWYKTFTRDVKYLLLLDKITIRRVLGGEKGVSGNRTMLKLNGGENNAKTCNTNKF